MTNNYPLTCFHYIHQNPMKAKLVDKMEDWQMSSFRDYAGLRNDTLCSKQLAYELLEKPQAGKQFMQNAYSVQIIEESV